MKKTTTSISKKFANVKLKKNQMNQVKGGGWGNGDKDTYKNCPPPNSGVWKRNDM